MKIDILGLLGFTVSGMLFVISALRNGDIFSLAGSVVWIISCLGWIGALVSSRLATKYRRNGFPRRGRSPRSSVP